MQKHSQSDEVMRRDMLTDDRSRASLALLVATCMLAGTACSDDTPDNAQVYFQTDAILCSPLLVEKLIDGTVVARDTMRSGKLSVAYVVPPGTHKISARVISLDVQIPFTDTTVTLAKNESFTRVLPFYCS